MEEQQKPTVLPKHVIKIIRIVLAIVAVVLIIVFGFIRP